MTGPEGRLRARGEQAGAAPSRGGAEGSPRPSRPQPHPVRPAEREARASRGGAGPAGSGEGRWRDGPRPPPEKGLRAGAPGSRAALTVEDCSEQRRFREARRAATASSPGPLLRRRQQRRQRRWRRPELQWRRRQRLPGSGIGGGGGGGGSCTSAPATTSALAQVPPHPEPAPHWVSEARGCPVLPKRAVIAGGGEVTESLEGAVVGGRRAWVGARWGRTRGKEVGWGAGRGERREGGAEVTARRLGCVRTGRAPGGRVRKLGAFLVQVRGSYVPTPP